MHQLQRARSSPTESRLRTSPILLAQKSLNNLHLFLLGIASCWGFSCAPCIHPVLCIFNFQWQGGREHHQHSLWPLPPADLAHLVGTKIPQQSALISLRKWPLVGLFRGNRGNRGRRDSRGGNRYTPYDPYDPYDPCNPCDLCNSRSPVAPVAPASRPKHNFQLSIFNFQFSIPNFIIIFAG